MLEMVIDHRPHDLGHGLAVRRILPFHGRRMVGPFIFLDHAGPLDLPGELRRKADVRPHPHIGLATVSYLFDGQITHRDSLGVEQVIVPGEVNWMTAGRSISHSERLELPASGEARPIELIQSWCALPEADEEAEPAFANYAAADLPVADADGVWMRLIAGAAYGLTSPVAVRSPLFYLHVALKPAAELKMPADYGERATYIASVLSQTCESGAGVNVIRSGDDQTANSGRAERERPRGAPGNRREREHASEDRQASAHRADDR